MIKTLIASLLVILINQVLAIPTNREPITNLKNCEAAPASKDYLDVSQDSARLWDASYLEKKTEMHNEEIEALCGVKMDLDMAEEGEAKEVCKYRHSYRETIDDPKEYEETIDKCNTILCTWFQHECFTFVKSRNETDGEKVFSPEEITCNCLQNLWNQGNCSRTYVKPENDTEEVGTANRVGEEDVTEKGPSDEVLQALKELGDLSPEVYSEEQQKCFADKKVFFQGKCRNLRDKKVCGKKTEWLVLKKPDSRLVPVCQKRPCGGNEIWSTVLRRCLSMLDFKKRFCDDDTSIAVSDAYGEGVCTCANTHVQFPDSDMCYELYQTGPCKSDEVVTYNKLTGFGECSPDKCLAMNHRQTRQKRQSDDMISFVANRNLFAPLDGVGTCYTLGGPYPCIKDDAYSRFVINADTKLPSCTQFVALLYIIDGPSKCITNANNRCVNVISVEEENQLEFLLGLKNQFKRKRDTSHRG